MIVIIGLSDISFWQDILAKDIHKIIVIDPYPQNFYRILNHVDVQDFAKRVLVLDKIDQTIFLKYLPFWDEFIKTNQPIRVCPEANDAQYTLVKTTLTHFLDRRRLDWQASYHTEFKITRNMIKNIPCILSGNHIKNLDDVLGDSPILLIGPGPSLDSILPELKSLSNQLPVMVLDTAIPVCLHAGIIPDIVVSFDYTPKNVRHFSKEIFDCPNTIFCLDPAVFPEIAKNIQAKNAFFYSNEKPILNWIEKYTGSFGAIHSSSTVAYIAFQLIKRMTRGEIILAGLDLCFQEKAYAQHSQKSDIEIEKINGQYNKIVDKGAAESIRVPLIQTQNTANEPVFTDANFMQMKSLIEMEIIGRTCFSVTQGLPIKGVSYVEISKLSSIIPKTKIDITPAEMPVNDVKLDISNEIKHIINEYDRILLMIKDSVAIQPIKNLIETDTWASQFVRMLLMAQLFFREKSDDQSYNDHLYIELTQKAILLLHSEFDTLLDCLKG